MQLKENITSSPADALTQSFVLCMRRSPETETEAKDHLSGCLWCAGWVDGFRARGRQRERYTNLMLEEWRAGGCDADGYLAGSQS